MTWDPLKQSPDDGATRVLQGRADFGELSRAAARPFISGLFYRSTPSISLPHLKHFFSWIWYLRIWNPRRSTRSWPQ